MSKHSAGYGLHLPHILFPTIKNSKYSTSSHKHHHFLINTINYFYFYFPNIITKLKERPNWPSSRFTLFISSLFLFILHSLTPSCTPFESLHLLLHLLFEILQRWVVTGGSSPSLLSPVISYLYLLLCPGCTLLSRCNFSTSSNFLHSITFKRFT